MRKWIAAIAALVAVVSGSAAASSAQALPLAPTPVAPVTGIPTPCPTVNPYPAGASVDELKKDLARIYGLKLAGSQWTEGRRESIKILWETLDAVSCTPYLTDLESNVKGKLGLNATHISGYAWGDWSLTRVGYVSLDFSKFQRALDAGDEGRLVRLVVHELGHVRNSDRFEEPAYWSEFTKLYAREGRFSDYSAGSVTETFADVVGYYVGRCALDNPYDTGSYDAYYEYAKNTIFGGKEFGPAPGQKPDCVLPDPGAEEPTPGEELPVWMEGLGGQ